eukprot:5987810-Alexandrium_andersonii.AAC.1
MCLLALVCGVLRGIPGGALHAPARARSEYAYVCVPWGVHGVLCASSWDDNGCVMGVFFCVVSGDV